MSSQAEVTFDTPRPVTARHHGRTAHRTIVANSASDQPTAASARNFRWLGASDRPIGQSRTPLKMWRLVRFTALASQPVCIILTCAGLSIVSRRLPWPERDAGARDPGIAVGPDARQVAAGETVVPQRHSAHCGRARRGPEGRPRQPSRSPRRRTRPWTGGAHRLVHRRDFSRVPV